MQETKQLYRKEGFVQQSVGAIVALIVGVGIATLVLIFVGALGGQTYNLVEDSINEIGNTTETAYSAAIDNVTAVSLGHTTIHQGSLILTNATTGIEVGLGNFTIDYTAGTAQLLADAGTYNGTHLANYTWGSEEIRASVKSGILSGFEAIEQTGNYLPIIVLAVVIVLILTLILSFTAFGGGGMDYGKGSAL